MTDRHGSTNFFNALKTESEALLKEFTDEIKTEIQCSTGLAEENVTRLDELITALASTAPQKRAPKDLPKSADKTLTSQKASSDKVEPLELYLSDFPLMTRPVARVLTSTIVMFGYSFLGGLNEYTADGSSTDDTATEIVLCRVVNSLDDKLGFVYFDIAYSLACSGHSGGVEDITKYTVRVWNAPGTLKIAKDAETTAIRSIELLLAKDSASLMSRVSRWRPKKTASHFDSDEGEEDDEDEKDDDEDDEEDDEDDEEDDEEDEDN